MRTDAPTYQMFTADERAFLEHIFKVMPHIGEKFDHYLALPPIERITEASKDARAIKRTGWVKWQVTDPESIGDHMNSLAALVRKTPVPQGVDVERAAQMAIAHDVPEVIATDFTPYDDITKDDKHTLEELAARVVFEYEPEVLASFMEYEAQESVTAHWVNDCDKLDAVYRAVHYEALYPKFEGALINEFVTTSKSRMKTDEGKALLADVEANSLKMVDDLREKLEAKVFRTYN